MFNWLQKLLHREQTSKKEKLASGFIAFLYIFTLGYQGNIMDKGGQAFYETLIKPGATPPEWLFPFVWTALFVLIGLSAYYAWNFYDNDRYRKIFVGLYAANGILVYLWPCFFFTRQDITSALYIIITLIIVIELMIVTAFKVNHRSAYLLMPYLAWILFATYLNASFLILNS